MPYTVTSPVKNINKKKDEDSEPEEVDGIIFVIIFNRRYWSTKIW